MIVCCITSLLQNQCKRRKRFVLPASTSAISSSEQLTWYKQKGAPLRGHLRGSLCSSSHGHLFDKQQIQQSPNGPTSLSTVILPDAVSMTHTLSLDKYSLEHFFCILLYKYIFIGVKWCSYLFYVSPPNTG